MKTKENKENKEEKKYKSRREREWTKDEWAELGHS